MKKALLPVILGFTFLSACASKPILLPNEKYNRVGHTRSEEDIERCINVADHQLEKTQGRRALRGAAKGAIIGGLLGGAIGSSSGNLAGGAVGGAAMGGGVGAIGGALETPEEARRGLVNYCLQKKGYEVAGWD